MNGVLLSVCNKKPVSWVRRDGYVVLDLLSFGGKLHATSRFARVCKVKVIIEVCVLFSHDVIFLLSDAKL
jgi:hypothetical protein